MEELGELIGRQPPVHIHLYFLGGQVYAVIDRNKDGRCVGFTRHHSSILALFTELLDQINALFAKEKYG